MTGTTVDEADDGGGGIGEPLSMSIDAPGSSDRAAPKTLGRFALAEAGRRERG
jgi:hypothetical protein